MNTLNQEQRAVVESPAKHRMVIAGPGSGKTTVLVAAIAEAVKRGINSSEIIVLTFTNAAADELETRLAREFGGEGTTKSRVVKLGFCGTLHSFLFGLLKKHGALVGLPEGLSVLDEDAVQDAVETTMAELGVKCPLKKVMAVLNLPNLVYGVGGMSLSKEEVVAKAFHAELRRAGLLTFDTILHYGERLVGLLPKAMELRDNSRPWWPYKALFVDETQDSSAVDWRIYDAMPCELKFFVGDADQAIYSFRGGDVREFVERSAGANDDDHKVFVLEKNFRCASKVCEAANLLIRHNAHRVPKATSSIRSGGEVTAHAFPNPAAEQCFVVDEIVDKMHMWGEGGEGDEDYGEFAVLCRTNALVRQFADFLRGCGIPVAEKKRRATPPDWKKAKLLLTLLANPHSDFAAHAYLVAKLGREKADVVKREAAKAMTGIAAFCKFSGGDDVGLSLVGEGISSESRTLVHDAARLLSARGEWAVADLLLYLQSGEADGESVGEGVTVCTVHAAKGREWAVVFVVGMEEGTFPSAKSVKAGDAAVEECRRLCFVAATRAKDRLCFTRSEARPESRGPNMPPGPMTPREPSRFIRECGL